jgi:ABC-2 type transport system permease protein
VLAQGTSLRTWLAGKTLGLAGILAIPVGITGAAMFVGALFAAPEASRADIAARAGLLLATHSLLLWTLLAVGVAISALTASTRAALTAALAVWIGGFVLAPRAASTLAESLAPSPTLADYRASTSKVFDEGFDSRGGYATQLKALEAQTIRRYGVARLADLPVGFSGIRMKHMDAWSAEVDDREYDKLKKTYARQSQIRMVVALLAPYIAARNLSQGLAGTDWTHYQHFLSNAESYRREFGRQMNSLIEDRVVGERWEMDGTNEDWAGLAPLRYSIPTVHWALMQQGVPLVVLLTWATLAALACFAFASRRLRP